MVRARTEPYAVTRLRSVAFLLLLGLLLTVCSSLRPIRRLPPWGWPDWVMMLTVYLALRAELWLASLTAFALGGFKNALGLGPDGIDQLALLLAAGAVKLLSRSLKLLEPTAAGLLTGALDLLKNAIFMPGFMTLMNWPYPVSAVILAACLGQAVMTGVAASFFFGVLDRLFAADYARRSSA
ncbi:MAG: hypothetical protein LBU12_01770 [Deltaproteobacteria bacterium]|jgi:hypothetical protein|nr:hypothetical protein [Deltaproteobacteria bacterium]